MPRQTNLIPRAQRGPMRVMFIPTMMDVGGAEMLLAEIIRGLDRTRFLPQLCCLKHLGTLGETLAEEVPTYSNLIGHKYDLPVLRRLMHLLRSQRIDAVITVGTGGDKMFWGRLAAWRAGVPVICSALHSTGLPDHVEWQNRLLTPLTDAFIAVAESHGRYIAKSEGCPADKVCVIPNGVDVERFRLTPVKPGLREELGLPEGTPVAGIVAALRPEKDHELFLRVAARVRAELPAAKFLIVGDGARRARLEKLSVDLGLQSAVQFLGARPDVPDLLMLMDVLVLTSIMEANPVSILEAMAAERPVVAPRVGSIPDSVREGETGFLAPAGAEAELASHVLRLLSDRSLARRMGSAGRERVVARFSRERMVEGYEDLIASIYDAKTRAPSRRPEAELVAS